MSQFERDLNRSLLQWLGQNFGRNHYNCWALVFPDGRIHAAWMYETKQLLQEIAPSEMTGAVTSWRDMVARGYRLARVQINITRKTK